jgi:O-antigen ligase
MPLTTDLGVTAADTPIRALSDSGAMISLGQVSPALTVFKIFAAVLMPATIIAIVVFWIIALVGAIRRKDLKSDRLVWILLIVFTGIIGSTIYFFMEGRKKLGIASCILFGLLLLALVVYPIMIFAAAIR